MNAKDIGAIVAGLVIIAMTLFIAPLIALLVGWFVGFIIEFATGGYTTDTMNVLAGTDRFGRGDFARLTAITAVLASFFAVRKSGKAND